METAGRLTREKFGYSMPVDAPLYPKPPIHYRNAESISVVFETASEAAAEMVPEGLTVPAPATAIVSVMNYPFSTLGTYREAILSLLVLRDAEPAFYIAQILVDNDQAMTAGREIWGYPKKLANISLESRGEGMVGIVERPLGNRLCTVVVQPEKAMEDKASLPVLSLRVLPSQREDGGPDLAQLIETRTTATVHHQWSGRGSLSLGTVSELDPWSRLPIHRISIGMYRQFDLILPLGKVVREYH